MNLQTSHASSHRPVAMMVPPPGPSGFEGVVLRHLRTPAEIESVLHLREEIDLSVHASASSNFASLEKKETNWGSCSHSSSMAS
jgi:hypothetical protein